MYNVYCIIYSMCTHAVTKHSHPHTHTQESLTIFIFWYYDMALRVKTNCCHSHGCHGNASYCHVFITPYYGIGQNDLISKII